MVARLGGVLLLVLLCTRGVPAIDSGSPAPEPPPIPPLVGGVELEGIHGWLANIYPWKYLPDLSTVYPVRALWASPNDYQSPADIARQNALLEEYGSGADVLEYSANPDLPDHNHWLRTYFTNGDRPFFVAYEHIYGTRLIPDNGAKDMNVRYNRIAFKNDIDAIYRNVVVPFGRRYVTYHGRAVIYLRAASAMYGDFASLLDELRAQYPVAFIGSVGLMQLPTDAAALRNFSALDGFMEYVIESQCISDTLDKRNRWVGCGTGRLDILKEYFGS